MTDHAASDGARPLVRYLDAWPALDRLSRRDNLPKEHRKAVLRWRRAVRPLVQHYAEDRKDLIETLAIKDDTGKPVIARVDDDGVEQWQMQRGWHDQVAALEGESTHIGLAPLSLAEEKWPVPADVDALIEAGILSWAEESPEPTEGDS